MNILITAIGSMSAQCVISSLKTNGHLVCGTDIYPSNWHFESQLCDKFFKVPFYNDANYIPTLIDITQANNITHLIPLTDAEIDVLNLHREVFEKKNVTLCIPDENILHIVRDKFTLFSFFKEDDKILVPHSSIEKNNVISTISLPCIAKKRNGRSSEGLMKCNTIEDLRYSFSKEGYLWQKNIPGNVFTIDVVRSKQHNKTVAIPREELIRTNNGAGTTVAMHNNTKLIEYANYICQKLNVNGCINIEFINSQNNFYLIDINPRFSAGVAFSKKAGYDFAINHLNCFTNTNIDSQITIKENIFTKRYTEVDLV